MAAALGTLLLCALLLSAQAQSQEESVQSEARGESDVTGTSSRSDSSDIFIGASPHEAKSAVCEYAEEAIKDRVSRHDYEMFFAWAKLLFRDSSPYILQRPAESKRTRTV